MAGQGFNYAVDLVMCIDVTGSMSGIIDTVKKNALTFYKQFKAAMTLNVFMAEIKTT